MTGFAHGFIEWDGSEHYTLGHGGNTAAFSAQVNIVPEENFGVVILTNSAGESEISLGLTQALVGKRNQPAPSSPGNLPSASEVEGSFVSARRMHNSFLELYSYLSLVDVRAVDDNVIELSMGGQSATLVQTRPYVFERDEAEGLLNYIFDMVYFEVVDGRVQRMSGDLLPLPPGRTRPWLMASILIAGFSVLYFSVSPVILLIKKLRSKRRTSYDTFYWRRYMGLLTLTGTAVLANNALLIARMLIDNYRSFAQVRIHVLINYPLFVLAAVLILATILQWRRSRLTRGQKFWTLTTIFTMLAFAGLLANWQFLTLLA
ncbi:MAG: hypothetical protein FH749_14645 [Firmicutes bacterium]|nr:hypothetical protein [Bacillota bacterium]